MKALYGDKGYTYTRIDQSCDKYLQGRDHACITTSNEHMRQ